MNFFNNCLGLLLFLIPRLQVFGLLKHGWLIYSSQWFCMGMFIQYLLCSFCGFGSLFDMLKTGCWSMRHIGCHFLSASGYFGVQSNFTARVCSSSRKFQTSANVTSCPNRYLSAVRLSVRSVYLIRYYQILGITSFNADLFELQRRKRWWVRIAPVLPRQTSLYTLFSCRIKIYCFFGHHFVWGYLTTKIDLFS